MRDRLSSIHNNMKARCYNPNCISYKQYGKRGITICDEWRNSEKMGKYSKGYLSFKEWALSHGYQEGLTIDRVDNNKGYSPDNCRWVSPTEQSNNRRNNHYITYNNKTQSLMDWCNELKLNYKATEQRLNKLHWSVEKAFNINVRPNIKMVTYKGETKPLKKWCQELQLNYHRVACRLLRDWSIEKAFETPLQQKVKLKSMA